MSANREEYDKFCRERRNTPEDARVGELGYAIWLACAELKDAEIEKLREELDACQRANKWHSEEISAITFDRNAGNLGLHHLKKNNDALRAEMAALKSQGDIVVTKDTGGRIVAVTRQDEDYRVISVVATSTPSTPDCTTCQNRGKVNGDSQETYCENCKHWMTSRKDFYVAANYAPLANDYSTASQED